MPKIKAFRGIRPDQRCARQLVLEVENLSLQAAKDIREENPYSYVNMLVPKVDSRYLRGSKREMAYKKINENFEDFLEKGILIRDSAPALYIYQIRHKGLVQTGIWTVTCIDDYLNNTIRKHELTRADRERALIDYLQQTGVDANPVLITYKPVPHIEKFIERKLAKQPDLDFSTPYADHRLWKIDTPAEIVKLIKEFAKLPVTYIADGHHRAAAASLSGIERRNLNLKHTGEEEYNFFNSVYMATSQLQIVEFNRLIKDLGPLKEDELLTKISENFEVTSSATAIKPLSVHYFGMYTGNSWYQLRALPHTYCQDNAVAELDVHILQEFLCKPILNIADARTDPRISFSGGFTPIEQLVETVDRGEFALAFTLFPTSIEQLISVADAGEVMPPKSTWFEPKFQAGLVIHAVD